MVQKQNGELKFLTLNTQLLPEASQVSLSEPSRKVVDGVMWVYGVCKFKAQRIPFINSLIGKYDIVGLQEVFDEYGQNLIVSAWLHNHGLDTWLRGRGLEILTLNSEDDMLKKILTQKKQKVSIEVSKTLGGSVIGQIIDARPNDKQAQIVYDRHFVMGPIWMNHL